MTADKLGGIAVQRKTPPFRADHVGSLLRPAALKEARAKHERHEITADALRTVEDRAIETAIAKQEEIGLQLATDGEFRRSWWQFDFLKDLEGVELFQVGEGIAFHGVATKAESVRVIGRVGYSSHAHIEHFKFLKRHSRVVPKMTIPAPGVLHFRQGRRSISRDAYAELDGYFEDVGNAYRKAVRAFYDAGCRYLQLDDTTWSMMCDERELAHSRERGDDPPKLPAAYAHMINRALDGKPADMTVTMHSCRGNFRSTWIAEGGYEPMAEQLFNEVGVDGYFPNTIPDVPAASSRCGFSRRATSSWCSGSFRPRPASWRARTPSSAASTRPANMWRSSSCVCRRNAASPRPRKATFCPRTSNGRNCG
jgi:5-methyltetrahydropteroyltriglutamate--homocysteine methyltransferase